MRDVSRRQRRCGLSSLLVAAVGAALLWASPASAAAPSIEGETVSGVGATGATLEASIDPNGASAGVFYQFQLLLDPGEAPTELRCPSSPPSGYSVCVGPEETGALPLGWISGGEAHTVSLELSTAGVDLTPGRTYYFRVLVANRIFSEDAAEWESPAVVGPSESFTTAALPSIEGESASHITKTDATLEAEVDQHGTAAGAYYQFQLATGTGGYASEILCPPTLRPGFSGCVGQEGADALPIGFLAGNTLQPSATAHASLDLGQAGLSLQPGTVYHYRILVARRVVTEDTLEWEPPTVFGGDRTFRTLPEETPSDSHSAAEEGSPAPAPESSSRHGRHRRHHRHHGRGHHHRLGRGRSPGPSG
jgi:hypothetical protein